MNLTINTENADHFVAFFFFFSAMRQTDEATRRWGERTVPRCLAPERWALPLS